MNKNVQNSNFILALVLGLAASVLLTLIWAYTSYLIHYQIGWMAVGVGFVIGWIVQYIGKGTTLAFAILGAALSLLTCISGNLLMDALFIASADHMPVLAVIKEMTFSQSLSRLTVISTATDLLFYGIAVYEGFRFSVVPSEQESVLAAGS